MKAFDVHEARRELLALGFHEQELLIDDEVEQGVATSSAERAQPDRARALAKSMAEIVRVMTSPFTVATCPERARQWGRRPQEERRWGRRPQEPAVGTEASGAQPIPGSRSSATASTPSEVGSRGSSTLRCVVRNLVSQALLRSLDRDQSPSYGHSRMVNDL